VTNTVATPAKAPARPGRLVVLSAPSGAGKTTLVKALRAADPALGFSISYTTRPPRPNEEHGRDYFFVDTGHFARMAGDREFLEHAEVFGHRYGTSREQVQAALDAGRNLLLEIDWQGARQVRANAPACVSVFILPPSRAELERRLRGRGTDSEAVIQRRLGQALGDMAHWAEFDHVVVNDQLDEAVAALRRIIAGQGEAWSTGHPLARAKATAIVGPAAG
jgi:guanylate kinase